MITIATRIIKAVGALLLGCVLFVPAAAAQAQTLDEIIEASLEAAGGRDAMARVTSVRRTGTFTMSITGVGDIDGDTEVVIIPNQKLYTLLDSDFIQETGAWNGTSGWQSDPMQGTVDVAAQTLLHPFLAYNRPELGPAESTTSRSAAGSTMSWGRPRGASNSRSSSTRKPSWCRASGSTRTIPR